jgi:hypothetical protein
MISRSLSRPAAIALLCVAAAAGGALAAGEKRTPGPARTPKAATDSLPGAATGGPLESTPAPRSEDDRLKTVAYDLVKVGENVHVHPDEVVRGDVVVIGGDLRVEGEVVGGAVVVGGTIQIGPKARIGGEAVAIGGRVDAAAGSQVRGGVVSLSFLPEPIFHGLEWGRAQRVTALVADLFKIGFLLLAVLLFAVLLPARLRRGMDVLEAGFLKCFGLGVLALTGGLFAVVVAVVLLAITLIGIPVALLVAFLTGLLLLASLVLGMALVGDKLREALRLRRRSLFLAGLLGLMVLMLPELGAGLLRFASGSASVVFGLQLLHAAMVLATLAAGLGALMLSKLGASSPGLLPAPRRPADLGGPGPGPGRPVVYEPFHEAEPPASL